MMKKREDGSRLEVRKMGAKFGGTLTSKREGRVWWAPC